MPTKRALLVSYVYHRQFLSTRNRIGYRDWVMDSGAFSAYNAGIEIKIEDFINVAKELRDQDPTLSEVFALDVIGDWRAGLRNCEKMWTAGVPAIPCYHLGEPEDVLRGIARDYPKIAIGGLAGRDICGRLELKNRFLDQCFSRVWPKRIHGFGLATDRTVMSFPFHTVDATNWSLRPQRYGYWRSIGDDERLTIRKSSVSLKAEVEWYERLENRARSRWSREMGLLNATGSAPTVRLAIGGVSKREAAALGGSE